jgi:hypothetical protein
MENYRDKRLMGFSDSPEVLNSKRYGQNCSLITRMFDNNFKLGFHVVSDT